MPPEPQDMPRALLTGGSGFLGANIARGLLHAGWQVHLLTRAGTSLDLLGDAAAQVAVHPHDGSTQGLVSLMQRARPEVVVHLASLFLVQHQTEDIEPLIASNLMLGTQLLQAMDTCGVRCLLNTGTSWQTYQGEVYHPVNLYAATKQAFEDVALFYVRARGLRLTTLRLFDTYGPGDPRRKLVPLLLDAARHGTPLALSPGEQHIDLLHVRDVVQAFVQCTGALPTAPAGSQQIYGLSSGQPLSLRSLVDLCAAVTQRPIQVQWGARPYREREVMQPSVPWPSPPGWQPAVSLASGIAQTFAAMGQTSAGVVA